MRRCTHRQKPTTVWLFQHEPSASQRGDPRSSSDDRFRASVGEKDSGQPQKHSTNPPSTANTPQAAMVATSWGNAKAMVVLLGQPDG